MGRGEISLLPASEPAAAFIGWFLLIPHHSLDADLQLNKVDSRRTSDRKYSVAVAKNFRSRGTERQKKVQ